MKGKEMAWSLVVGGRELGGEGPDRGASLPLQGPGLELGHMDLLWKLTRALRAVGWALGQG